MFIKKLSYGACIAIVVSLCIVSIFSLVAMEPEQKKIVVVGGFGVGNSIVTGRTAIVTKHKQLGKVCNGDILIAPTINHTWDLGLILPAGIITEKGGSHNHALSLGEKLGIPVIVGATGATKKIDDGSFITLDYSQKAVYTAEKNNFLPIKNDIIIALEGHHRHHHHEHHAIDIFSKQLKNDSLLIKTYVTETVAHDIKLAKKAGRWLAWCVNGLSYYAFDSIPFEFFSDHSAVEDVFKRLEEGVSYIHETKELFKQTILGNKTKIDEGALAEFLYVQAVEKIEVTDDYRELLKREPIKMDECVKKGVVNKNEYMYFTLCNFTVRYYLEQELKK